MKKIIFIDRNENEIINVPIIEIPIHEKKIIEKSIELFNDDEPCIIHKSFTIRAITYEICDYLKKFLDSNNEVLKESINEKILNLIDIQDFHKIKAVK
ncbi:MAG: hypothetical protein ABF289_15620 [Clostridiales bacterium]